MRNRRISETTLLEDTVEAITTHLPETWRAQPEPASTSGRPGPDLVMKIQAPDGREGLVFIEAKSRLDPKDVPSAVYQLRRYADRLRESDEESPEIASLYAAPFVSRRTREVLTSLGMGYADSTGNLRLTLNRPGLFLSATGADRDPEPGEPSMLRSLKGRGAGRAVCAFADFVPPYGIRELAVTTRTPAPTLSKVATFLEREAILEREKVRGRIAVLDWRKLLARWAEDYSFVKSNDTAAYLEPRGLNALVDKLRTYSGSYALTGSLAAAPIAPVATPRLAVLYVGSVSQAAAALGLRRAETGGNVLLAQPFDPVVFDRTTVEQGLTYAALSQVAVDLMTGPGRSPAEGEALLNWMGENEDKWRSSIR